MLTTEPSEGRAQDSRNDSKRSSANPLISFARMMRRAFANLVLSLWNTYFSHYWIRRLYAVTKNISLRVVYPIMPWLHQLVFIKFKSFLNRHLTQAYGRSGQSAINYLDLSPTNQSIPAGFPPKVSIIVPNYNHSAFLRRRLDSIYQQTYRNFEVILLDDASTDDSLRILEEYAQRYPEITRCLFNTKNSGSVFNQWRLGLQMAQGDLIWIAESDDYCTTNMLADLVRFFKNEAVMLAYCRTVFVKGTEDKQIWSIEEYLLDLEPNLWLNEFVRSAHHLVSEAWSIKNIVPNVSSALFRHPGGLDLLDDEKWRQMRICGDWVFYLHLIRGGLVAYTPQVTNYFRMHQENTSVSTYDKDIYYIEHEKVAQELMALYRVPEDRFERQRKQLESHWRQCRPEYSEEAFKKCYDYVRIKPQASARKPNILMVIYALAAGGGETFPLTLANLLKGKGYGITVFNCRQEPTEPGVRKMLRSDIPLLELEALVKLGLVISDMGIEIVHSHHAWVDLTCCSLLEYSDNTRSVITMHGMYEMIDPADVLTLAPLLNKRVSKFVYTAEKNLTAFNPEIFNLRDFIKIDNALERVPFHPVPRNELGIPEEAFILCLVSRAIPEKGWEEAIEAVTLARKTVQRDIHLLLIGEGPEEERLKPIFKNHYTHFLGFQPNIRRYFAMADLGLLPTRFLGESFPLVLIDCLHSNRPMIATNAGEIPSMLDTEAGPAGTILEMDDWVIPIDKLARVIADYAQNPDLYQQHLQRVPEAASKFDQKIMLQSYETVYQEIFQELQLK